MSFLRLIDGLVDRLLCIAAAVGFSQGPEFMQQYLQRLGGHLNEAQRQLATFRSAANEAGLTLPEFIARTNANPDTAVSRLGGVMHDSGERVASLQSAHDSLLHAAPWERPVTFIRHFDSQIADATWAVYKPAVPTTLEGLAYALVGVCLVLGTYHLITAAVRAMFRRRRSTQVATT